MATFIATNSALNVDKMSVVSTAFFLPCRNRIPLITAGNQDIVNEETMAKQRCADFTSRCRKVSREFRLESTDTVVETKKSTCRFTSRKTTKFTVISTNIPRNARDTIAITRISKSSVKGLLMREVMIICTMVVVMHINQTKAIKKWTLVVVRISLYLKGSWTARKRSSVTRRRLSTNAILLVNTPAKFGRRCSSFGWKSKLDKTMLNRLITTPATIKLRRNLLAAVRRSFGFLMNKTITAPFKIVPIMFRIMIMTPKATADIAYLYNFLTALKCFSTYFRRLDLGCWIVRLASKFINVLYSHRYISLLV